MVVMLKEQYNHCRLGIQNIDLSGYID